jgi:type I restriction enzyme S subunit
MNPDLLFTNFDRLSDTPESVSRLRQFIFQLAVRGKLTNRNSKDETASELLKRIQAEKVRRITKSGEQRQPLTVIDPAQTPIPTPKHWVWLRLSDVGLLSGGMTPSKNRPDFWDGQIDWFSPKDIKSDELFASEMKITAAGAKETGLQLYPPGCLFIVARSGILKRTLPVSINRVKATANQDLKVLNPFLPGMERYLQIMFIGMTDFILSALVKTGTTVQSLKYEEFESQPIPLPPLSEQHRIVAKVDELMILCDQLEAAQTERECRRRGLARSSLYHLSNGANTEALRTHTKFYLKHLSRVTTRVEHILELRQTILDLAVRGRLAHQNPGDEPASELLRRIHGEQERLGKKGTIPRQKSAIAKDAIELAFLRPSNWEAVRFGSVCNLITSGSRGWAEYYAKTGPKFIRAQNIRFGRLRLKISLASACPRRPKAPELRFPKVTS